MIFLRSVRAVGIVALAIPISIVGSIVALVALGRSVNVISLAGMAFATGMVVDNAIVVLENIYRHLEMGKDRARAALRRDERRSPGRSSPARSPRWSSSSRSS